MEKTEVTYKGTVQLSITIGGKKINITSHNAGEPALFKLLCQCLSSNYPGVQALPQYIMLEKNSSGSYIPYMNGKQPLSGKNYNNTDISGVWVASFSGVINYSSLIATIEPGDTSQYRLVLMSALSSDNILATIPVSARDLAKISPGTNLVVEWKMMFSNAD